MSIDARVEVSEAIARHVSMASGEEIDPQVLQATARSVLDAIGVSIGASGLGEGCRAFVEVATAMSGPGPCQVLGTDLRLRPAAAALANGAFADALDFEDAHDVALVHPNAAPVAAGLALVEFLAAGGVGAVPVRVSGRRFLAAVAVGADLVCRLGFVLTRPADERGWYPPPILGAIGAAATCANLLGLSPSGVIDAISLVTCQATCMGELKRSPRSVVRAVRDAFGAEGAVTSALLAAQGVTGYDRPLEGEAGVLALYGDASLDALKLLEDLGERFHGADVSFKPWPSCRGTHAFVDAALSLRDQIGERPISAVRLRGGSLNLMLVEPRPQKVSPATAIDAKFSLPFTVATALLRGRLELDDFEEAARHDPAVGALAQRVFFTADAERSGADWAQVSIELESGGAITRVVERPPGSPERPIDDEGLVEKFVRCAGAGAVPLEEGRARAYAAQLLGLIDAVDAAEALSAPALLS